MPAWLNTNNPKISIVDQSEIMPAEMLPTFVSASIERHIVNIPSLTEKFIYSNDDVFFNKTLDTE